MSKVQIIRFHSDFLIIREAVTDGIMDFRLNCFLLLLGLDRDHVVDDLVLPIGIYLSVEHGETVQIANVRRNASERVDLFFVGNSLLKHSFPLALQSAQHEKHKLIQILNPQLGIHSQFLYVVLHNVLRVHVQLVHLRAHQQITEQRFVLLPVELILPRVLTWRHKHNRLLQSRELYKSVLALHNALAQAFNAFVLLLALVVVALGDGGCGLAEGMKVEENLVSGLFLMDVVDG